MATIIVDGQAHEVEEGIPLIVALREKGYKVPSLCFHHALPPAGSCKLCVVEVKEGDKPPRAKMSCAVKTRDGMEITTESELITQMRNTALGTLLKMAPNAEAVHQIGLEYGLDTRFMPDGCIRCRLCVRACSDIIGAHALKMIKRDGVSHVVPSESGTCIGCGTCANICPTNVIRIQDDGNVRTIMIRDEVIGTHPLERCEMCGRYYATTRFLEHVKTLEESHPDEKKGHRHCPSCAKLHARQNLQMTAIHLSKTYGGKPDA